MMIKAVAARATTALLIRAAAVAAVVVVVVAVTSPHRVGVGMQAVQLARHDGARVLAVTSSEAKVADLEQAGAETVLVAPDLAFARAAREATGGVGVDVVLEIVGSVTFEESLKCLAPGGRLVVVGNLETGLVTLNPGLVIVKELQILGAYATTREELQTALELLETGVLRPWVSELLPLAEAWRAHRLLEDRAVTGRLVLVPQH